MRRSVLPLLALLPPACADDPAGADPDPAGGPAYVVGSVVFGPEGNQSYVSVLDSLDVQTIDYGRALELPGWADVWVWQGKVFIADGEAPIVRRYAVDDAGALVLEGELGFAAHGAIDVAFWNHVWVAPDKAYMSSGQRDYVIWDPAAMAITGTMPYPDLADRGAQRLRAATSDRGVVLRDGRLYQPYYWADDTWTDYAADSKIAVYDTATDVLVEVLDAPCPGLDIATADDDGNVYFSNWTGNVGLTLVRGAATPCGVRIAAGADTLDAAWTVTWPDLTEGRHAAALRYAGGDAALLSVFHDERTEYDASTDPWALVGSENWRIWSVDLASRAATPIEGIAWNSGATYLQRIDDASFVLVPSADYATSTVYAVDGTNAEVRFATQGWGIRLFQVR